jgi:hypothetical protein
LLPTLQNIISSKFPCSSNSSATEESAFHSQYATKFTQIFQRNEKLLLQLEKSVLSKDSALVITGKSGTGKTALLANWIQQYQVFYTPTIHVFLGLSS